MSEDDVAEPDRRQPRGQRPPGGGKRPSRDDQRGGRGEQRPARGNDQSPRGNDQRPRRASEWAPGAGRGTRQQGPDRRTGSGGRPATRERPRSAAPPLPDDVTGKELDREVRQELSGLSADSAKTVARHLVMAARLLEDEPEQALQHAVAARARAARIGVVREAVGLASYRSGKYADALAELRTARRLTGSNEHLPIMADCERGLGRPQRALDLAATPEVRTLDAAGRAEMLIVAAGARLDLGQPEAAVALLAVPELERRKPTPWLARLRSAYADALEAVGRSDEAHLWRVRASAADVDGTAGVNEGAGGDEDVVIDLDEESEPGEEHFLNPADLAPEPPATGGPA